MVSRGNLVLMFRSQLKQIASITVWYCFIAFPLHAVKLRHIVFFKMKCAFTRNDDKNEKI